MKKVILLLVVFAFALSLGVGSSIMFPQEAAADVCVDVPGVIYVKTSIECHVSKFVEGVIYYVYDGMLDGAEIPCDFIETVCRLDPAPNHASIK